jgi:hypothetical protein
MDISFINSCLSDLWNFHLVLIGISLSIFTLLYSFILNKRDELKAISEQIKSSGKNPTIEQKERFAISYIRRLRKFNANCLFIFIVSTFLCYLSWATLRLIKDSRLLFKQWLLIIIAFLTVFLCLYVALQFVKIYKNYNSETKV